MGTEVATAVPTAAQRRAGSGVGVSVGLDDAAAGTTGAPLSLGVSRGR